jgi:hypothetical protein
MLKHSSPIPPPLQNSSQLNMADKEVDMWNVASCCQKPTCPHIRVVYEQQFSETLHIARGIQPRYLIHVSLFQFSDFPTHFKYTNTKQLLIS